MSDVMSPASTDQALEMLTAALGYLAAADATEMTPEEQAHCLKVLERAAAIGAAARTSTLSAFTSGKGCSGTSSILPSSQDILTRNTPVRTMLIENNSYELDGCRETFGTQVGWHGLRNDGVRGEPEREAVRAGLRRA